MAPFPRWKLLLLICAAFCLSAATCNQGSSPAMAERNVRAPASNPEQAEGTQIVALEIPEPLTGIPGMDFSSLPQGAQKELAAVFTDEFCYCGCPHTLGACLKTHQCAHGKRMALLAASDAAAGVPAVEIILSLSRYYGGFSAPRQVLPVDPRQCQGSPDAPVTLVEFSDFECPFCAGARQVLDEVVKQSAGKARLCYAPYPLANHPHALLAGQAALFARDQGKFWAMHDALFEHQASLSRPTVIELASGMGLPTLGLAQALDSGKYLPELEASKELGRKVGVDATPTVFLNGRRFNLPFAVETLLHSIDDELEWSSHKNAWAAD